MSKGKCGMCNRTLTDNESILRGFGPECEQKRARYLAALDTTESELAELAASPSDVARRRMVAFKGALAAGRTSDATSFLASARRNHAEEVQEQAQTAEREAVLTVLRKGAAVFGYLNAQLVVTGKVASGLYPLLAAMVRDGQIVKLPNGQYAMPNTQAPVSTLDRLREQYGQAAVDAYLWASANSSAPDSEILAAVVAKAQADARAFDGEAGTLRDLVSERATRACLNENVVWNETAKAA